MFFSAIREVYSPTKSRITPLVSVDGSILLKEKSSIKVRWREHLSTLLNRPSTVDPAVLNQIPQKPVITSLDLPPPPPPPVPFAPTIDEVLKAIRQTSLGKPPAMNGIPAEIFKSAGPVALEALHPLLTSIWEEEDTLREFRNGTFVSLFKNRASKTVCGNHRSISPIRCWEDPGSGHPQPPHHQHLREKPARSPVWIPSKPQHDRHDLLCTPGAAKVHRTEYGPRCRLHRPEESLRHGQQRGPLSDSVQAGVPNQVREPDSPVPQRRDRTGTFRRWSIRARQHLQRRQARVSAGCRPLQPVLHLRAKPCHRGPWTGSVPTISAWRLPVRPSPTDSQDKDCVCWRLCPHG